MTAPFELQMNTQTLDETFAAIAQAGNFARLTPKLAAELMSQTELNFAAQGRPQKWAALAATTIAAREKKGRWPGPILQVSGALARSVVADSGPSYAAIGVAGSEHPYAAIQQFGGEAGRNRSVTIPARPYLPMDANGKATREAEDGILRVTYAWLNFTIR